MRIELCGGIGTGKTSLAKRLAKTLTFQPIHEDYNTVPFWKDFCRDYKTYEFEKNVGFLLAYGDLLRRFRAGERIFDFSFAQAFAFIAMSKDKEAAQPLRSILAYLVQREGVADIIVRVECGVREQMRRIAFRAREAEKGIDLAYLARLEAALESEAKSFCSTNGIKLLRFNSGSGSDDDRRRRFDNLRAAITRSITKLNP
jgi:deoxyadenosine/deoxycytidine kinase